MLKKEKLSKRLKYFLYPLEFIIMLIFMMCLYKFVIIKYYEGYWSRKILAYTIITGIMAIGVIIYNCINYKDNIIGKIEKIGETIYKYRYYIAITIFILCVFFEISGSSIGCWNDFVKTNVTEDGVIFGKSRGIRSDEWAVLTPMSFSQKFDGFKYFSDLVRGSSTDVFIVYGLPTLNIMEIFRPFQIGYLFLGLAKGLSFFWCGRFIALFLVSFELGMIITNKNKLLSLVQAILVTLSPMVQWWFAVNGIAEIFIFGQLAVILLHKYMNTDNFKKRILYLLSLIICAGGYILVFYPAWQIPMIYVFLGLAVWTIISNIKNCKINRKDIISIVIAILIFTICMIYVLYNSIDTIKAVMGTVYPGARMETGGNVQKSFTQYVTNIFFPLKSTGLSTNRCEEATMFTLFPMGIIIASIIFLREKKKDLGLICLLIPYIFLGIWCIWGFPEIMAKITLMTNSQASRSVIALGFIEILILIRGLSIIKEPLKRIPSILISIITTIWIVVLAERNNPLYVNKKMMICMGIMCVYLFYFILRYKSKYAKYLFTCGITFVMLMTGATVNPIRSGIDVIYDSEIIKEIQKINEKEQGKWIVEGLGFPYGNYLLMAGASTINSTNTYPDLEKWHKLDTDVKYEDIYNRYAHISINLKGIEEQYENKFELIQADVFVVNIIPQDLKELDIKYIFTVNDIEKYQTDSIRFELIYTFEEYKIYKVEQR